MDNITPLDQVRELRPRIIVCGVGGAGGNAVNNMIDADLEGVHFIAANTDSQALTRAKAPDRLQLGTRITDGLGAGARPEIGAHAAEDSLDDIRARLEGAHMVFITAGMGGGTGTGAAPIIARAARDLGVLAVAVVTKPFDFEGTRRMAVAEEGIAALADNVDTLIVIPNQNLFRLATAKTTFGEAFLLADEVLHSAVRGVTDLMVRPGVVNLDFADVRTVMNEMGKAMMGTGEATGERRAIEASHAAISNPLLDDVSLKGARGVLINIAGGPDLTLYEVDEAANEIRAEIDPNATIIIGSSFDEALEGKLRVSVVATGIGGMGEARGRRSEEQSGEEPSALLQRMPDASTAAAIELEREDQSARPVEHIVAQPAADRPSAFGLFGRRRRQTDEAPVATDSAAADALEHEHPDEFNEEELEIPAFLRRQAS